MVSIYYTQISEENHDRLLGNYLAGYSLGFQNKVLRYKRWQDAQLSLLGRMLLQVGFNELDFCFDESNLCYNKYKKPYFKGHPIKFNISHSGTLVACAITNLGEVGIDVEQIYEIDLKHFKTLMKAADWNRIHAVEDKYDAFFQFWTQKEAIVKASGMGLSIPLTSFEVINDQTSIQNTFYSSCEVAIQLDYKCHVAWEGNRGTPKILKRKIEF